jgi:hypothetical protein
VRPLKIVIVTQWAKSPTRSKASHQVDSRTEVRSPKRRCAKQREGEGAGRVTELRKMYSCGQWISPRKWTQSRRYPVTGRQQSCPRQGERRGHHRSLRAGHVFTGVTRELGRASRLLGNNSRSEGDRHNQRPGNCWPTRPAGEPNSARAGRDTKKSASTQGTGREPKANRPGWTKAVVATHSTAGQGATSARTRGEPKPKGPTIKAARQREGNAGRDVWVKERQERH